MSKPFEYFSAILAIFIGACFSSPSFSSAYEKILGKENHHLNRWKMPLVRLVIKDAKPHPNDHDAVSIEVNVMEIIRKGDLPLRRGPISAKWQTYRKMSSATPHSRAHLEPIGDELLDELMDSNLICFIGSTPKTIILYADGCFLDNTDNKETAIRFAKHKPIKEYLYYYAWFCIMLFPLIGLILAFALPRIGMAVSALSFPTGVYILSEKRDYDALIAYPALILAGLVAAFGFARWLHQMVKEEQAEKARARENETPKPD